MNHGDVFNYLQKSADQQNKQFAGISVKGALVTGHDELGREFTTYMVVGISDRVRSEIRSEALSRGLDVR